MAITPSHHLCLQIWLQSLAELQWTKQNTKSSKLYRVLLAYVPGQTVFLGSKITANGDCSREIKRRLLLGKKSYDNPRRHIKKQRHYFADKSPYHQNYVFSSTHVGMWELDHKEGWTPKNWCSWTVVLEKTLESLLEWRKIKLLNPKGDQSWIFIRRTHAEAEAPILWPRDEKSQLIRKDPDAGKDWR